MTRDPDADDTATAASAIDMGVDIGTDPNPATTGLLADEHISSFLRHIRRRAEGTVAGLVLDAAPPDTGTGVAADPAPGVAVPVVAAGPNTDVDVSTADGLLPGVADFDPALAGGGGDEVTAAAPDGADFDPTSLDSAWVDGDDATAAAPTSVWGDGDEVTATMWGAASARKRKHTAAARADDTDDGATATADFDPTSTWGGGGDAAAAGDFDPTSVWGDGDVSTADVGGGTSRGRKRKYAPARVERRQRRRGDRRGLRIVDRAPGSAGAHVGESGGSRVRMY